jgi:adenosylcobyric acid synthase
MVMKAIMVVGTNSHAGKSFLSTALCRIFCRKGWYVAPFKGQNMALNAYVTATGGEIGYAQAVQAWAGKIIPRVEMNPILLKPQGNMTSQVILKGKVAGLTTAKEYYEKYFQIGWEIIKDCIDTLGKEFDLLVCEGAGSPVEINLKHRDLTNMIVAKHLNANTVLVADIDRGGVFAHIVGTLELLESEERSLIKGIVINKFWGDKSLLDSGIDWLEKRTEIPVLGILPWIDSIFPAEDSLDLIDSQKCSSNYELKIKIIRLPRISNFTDFDPLKAESNILVEYINPHESLGYPDAVILPGSKTTIADLKVLNESGMTEQIKKYVEAGGTVLGICGGFQMLGKQLLDPQYLEGEDEICFGLDLIPIETTLTPQKVTRQRQVSANYPQAGLPIDGYEIHQGETQIIRTKIKEYKTSYSPIFDDDNLGLVDQSQSIWGTYLHGIFDNGAWRRAWLNNLRQKRGLPTLPTGIPNYRQQREEMLESIADFVEQHLDLKPILPN